MDNTFNNIDKFLNETFKTLESKSKEYSRNEDPFHNFRVASRLRGVTMQEAIDGFRLKHEISIMDIRNDIKEGILPSKDIVDEKFGDLINYYLLEYASIINLLNKENE